MAEGFRQVIVALDPLRGDPPEQGQDIIQVYYYSKGGTKQLRARIGSTVYQIVPAPSGSSHDPFTLASADAGAHVLVLQELRGVDATVTQRGHMTTQQVIDLEAAQADIAAHLLGHGEDHDLVTLGTNAAILLDLVGQQLSLDQQLQNRFLAGPESGTGDPTFRLIVPNDLPLTSDIIWSGVHSYIGNQGGILVNHLGLDDEIKTIASGQIDLNTSGSSNIRLRPQADTDPVDRLAGIAPMNDVLMQFCIIRPENDGDVITVGHEDTEATANLRIWTSDNLDVVLTATAAKRPSMGLLYCPPENRWIELWRPAGAVTSHGNTSHTQKKITHTFVWTPRGESLVVDEDWFPILGFKMPPSGEHGTYAALRARLRCGTAGTGTNTVKIQTATTVGGSRTDRATIALGTSTEVSDVTSLWTPGNDEYVFVRATAVGATAPKNVQLELLVSEELW